VNAGLALLADNLYSLHCVIAF